MHFDNFSFIQTILLLSRFGRDYYIKEAQKASGERKRRSDLLAQIQQQNAALSDQVSSTSISSSFHFINTAHLSQPQPTTLETTFNSTKPHPTPTLNHTETYLMKKFLNDSNIQKPYSNSAPPSRSASLNLKSNGRPKMKKTPFNKTTSNFVPNDNDTDGDDNSISLNMFTPKRPHSISDFNINLPPKALTEFEENILHNNLRRDSFISRKTTKNFVLNPIYDDDEIDSGFHSIDHGRMANAKSKKYNNHLLIEQHEEETIESNDDDINGFGGKSIKNCCKEIDSATTSPTPYSDTMSLHSQSPELVQNVFINLNRVRNVGEIGYKKDSPSQFYRNTGHLRIRNSFNGRY